MMESMAFCCSGLRLEYPQTDFRVSRRSFELVTVPDGRTGIEIGMLLVVISETISLFTSVHVGAANTVKSSLTVSALNMLMHSNSGSRWLLLFLHQALNLIACLGLLTFITSCFPWNEGSFPPTNRTQANLSATFYSDMPLRL